MSKKFLIFLLLLITGYLLPASSAFAYGENCIESQGPSTCRANSTDQLITCPQPGNPPEARICRCKEIDTPAGTQRVTECSAQAESFDDCAAFEDRTWVGTFRTCMNLGESLNAAIQWAIILAGAAALARLLIGAVQYIMSSGDPKSVQNARETLTNAVIGLILVASAWLIADSLSAGFEEYGLPIKFTELIFGP